MAMAFVVFPGESSAGPSPKLALGCGLSVFFAVIAPLSWAIQRWIG
jgi:hypothetical protein